MIRVLLVDCSALILLPHSCGAAFMFCVHGCSELLVAWYHTLGSRRVCLRVDTTMVISRAPLGLISAVAVPACCK